MLSLRSRLPACAALLMLPLQTSAASSDELDLGRFHVLTPGDSIRVQVLGSPAIWSPLDETPSVSVWSLLLPSLG